MTFANCKNPMDVLAELKRMAENVPFAKDDIGDKYILVGINARGAEFISFLDTPSVDKMPEGYEKLVIYKELKVLK